MRFQCCNDAFHFKSPSNQYRTHKTYARKHKKPQITGQFGWINVSKMGWIICHSHALQFPFFFVFVEWEREGERKRRLFSFYLHVLWMAKRLFIKNPRQNEGLICVPFVTRYSHLSQDDFVHLFACKHANKCCTLIRGTNDSQRTIQTAEKNEPMFNGFL